MQHVGATAPVAKAASETIDEPDGLVCLPQQSHVSALFARRMTAGPDVIRWSGSNQTYAL